MLLFLLAVLIVPPAVLISLPAITFRKNTRGKLAKKALLTQFAGFAVLMVLVSVLTFSVSAADKAVDAPVSQNESAAPSEKSNDLGLGLIAAGMVTGLAGIGGGIAVAAGAPAAIAATSEDPKTFGKALIFVALGESIALYGVVISILILNKL